MNIELLMGGVIQKEAIFTITTYHRKDAVVIAIEKARKQLNAFDYIDKSSINIEKKRKLV